MNFVFKIMSIPKYIERLALIVESLKKDILFEYNLSWTEYLVLCLVNQFEKKDIHPTPQEVIRTSGKNRGWIYRAIRKLNEAGYISFWEGKPFKPGRLYLGLYGKHTLRRINTILARRIRGI
jgi:DNA-binding MarR family transcriptional regulator